MMKQSAASLLVRFSVPDRALVRRVLAELSSGADCDLVLRRGRITADEARFEVEIRAGRGRLESALRALGRPGVTVHSYTALVGDSAPAAATLSAVAGVPTLPPASAPRLRVAVPM